VAKGFWLGILRWAEALGFGRAGQGREGAGGWHPSLGSGKGAEKCLLIQFCPLPFSFCPQNSSPSPFL